MTVAAMILWRHEGNGWGLTGWGVFWVLWLAVVFMPRTQKDKP